MPLCAPGLSLVISHGYFSSSVDKNACMLRVEGLE